MPRGRRSDDVAFTLIVQRYRGRNREFSAECTVDRGTVTFAGLCDCGLGYYVEIDHGGGIVTQYGHMAEQPYVAVGQQVSQGETIGPLGSSGTSTGPHVHFVVKENGVNQDPLNYLL